MIDLRSDTVTKPTPAMRKAMAEAEVGDDVYGEDPTVNRLQEMAAEIFGKEAAIFVPTGSMGNQLAVKLHTNPGDEVVIEERGHILNWELGAPAVVSGVTFRTVRAASATGMLTWEEIETALHVDTPYYSCPTGLICLENTHNFGGGSVMSSAETAVICDNAHSHGIPVHIDGARIFNAATALGESVAQLSEKADSVQFCLSKGLGAPIGSVLVGKKDFIDAARSWRKRLGGGMRQVGVIAAAGLVALDESPKRLREDHSNAQRLAVGLAEIRDISIDPDSVKTNIVIFSVESESLTAKAVSERLLEHGIIASPFGKSIRMVTHCDIDADDIDTTLATLAEILNGR